MISWTGKPVAESIEAKLRPRIKKVEQSLGRPVTLAVVLVGEDPASQVYVRNKEAACQRLGLRSQKFHLPEATTQIALEKILRGLNADLAVDAILVQLPLPKHLSTDAVLDVIDPKKDPDGLTPENVGLLVSGRPRVASCTPAGVIEILKHYKYDLGGKRACVVGRSLIVGKPMAQLLTDNDCTVTVAHSKTKDLIQLTRACDLVVVAAGRPRFLGVDAFAKGSVVVDVGIHRMADGKLCGDVRTEELINHCLATTPVPGGVGPLTIAMLLNNTVVLAENRASPHK
jgi:methylenetetrahydrofolate dehydrogenase (NADP+)/methenyltetrahydrofolate cyclohydrolase